MCNSSISVWTEDLCCHFCLKEAQRNRGIISTASTEEVDQAGVMGFTSYLCAAEEITWGWIIYATHTISSHKQLDPRQVLSTKRLLYNEKKILKLSFDIYHRALPPFFLVLLWRFWYSEAIYYEADFYYSSAECLWGCKRSLLGVYASSNNSQDCIVQCESWWTSLNTQKCPWVICTI